MVPREYANECIVRAETGYNVPPDSHAGTYARSGKLDIGRVVWTRTPLGEPQLEDNRCIKAYVEGVGEVELDPKCLQPF